VSLLRSTSCFGLLKKKSLIRFEVDIAHWVLFDMSNRSVSGIMMKEEKKVSG
jgi:hypothetical protein